MPIATGTAIALAAGLGAAGTLTGSALSANAAGNAASTQAGAAEQNAQLQYQLGEQNLGLQSQVYGQQQANQAPFLESGVGALTTLDSLMGLPTPNVPANYGQPSIPSFGTSPAPFTGLPAGYGQLSNGQPLMRGLPTPGGKPLLNVNAEKAMIASPTEEGGGIATGGSRADLGGGDGRVPGGSNGAPNLFFANQPGSAQSTVSKFGVPGVGTTNGQLVPFAPWNQTFTAPTAEQARQTPGYQFTLDQGMKAVQNSAAAKGDLLSGNTLTSLQDYGQGLADTTYNDTYNRALQAYQTNYNTYQNNQTNQFNRLAALSGIGQTAASQLNSAGGNYGSNVGSLLLNLGNNISQQNTNAAAANASGYVGAANAYSGALSGLGNYGTLLALAPYLTGRATPTTGGINLG